jgi:endonuclease/exonuclease/phosphatase (EEP) superfamily protein YafD
MLNRFAMQNYEAPDSPKFEGGYAAEPVRFDGVLTAVSYNINFGEFIDEALDDMRGIPRPDVVMLQEMDEEGTDKIAQAMGLNYVYYPASVHKHHKNFGNAVLSRWPIVRTQKLILPRRHPANRQMRIATKARLKVGGTAVCVYCVHTEVYLTSRQHRRDQIEAIIQDLALAGQHAIVGGDFNTVRRTSIRRLVAYFEEMGFVRASKGVGPTIKKLRVSPSAADHIFTRGMRVVAAGRQKEIHGSDHYPIWVQVAFDDAADTWMSKRRHMRRSAPRMNENS